MILNTQEVEAPSPKVVKVTRGFDVTQASRLNATPRSQSPVSGRGTPVMQANSEEDKLASAKKEPKSDPTVQYKKERGDSKENLYMIVIGHVDAGKSTLMGHLLCSLGQVRHVLL